MHSANGSITNDRGIETTSAISRINRRSGTRREQMFQGICLFCVCICNWSPSLQHGTCRVHCANSASSIIPQHTAHKETRANRTNKSEKRVARVCEWHSLYAFSACRWCFWPQNTYRHKLPPKSLCARVCVCRTAEKFLNRTFATIASTRN